MGEPLQWSMWPTPAGVPCRRCRHLAREHEHSGHSTACDACRCPSFAGSLAWLVHLFTRWWP